MARSLSKEEIRQQHPLYGIQRIEVHHDTPKFRGGDNSDKNKVPLTLPEHALAHLNNAAKLTNRRDIEKEMGAFRLIIHRMTDTEVNQLTAKLPQCRPKGIIKP